MIIFGLSFGQELEQPYELGYLLLLELLLKNTQDLLYYFIPNLLE